MYPNKLYQDGLVKCVLDDNVGKLKPLVFNLDFTKSVALMNPSFYNDNGKLLVNIRSTNYVLHHSEKGLLPHWAGPLQYVHPEDDIRLGTENYLAELNDELDITVVHYVKMKNISKPVWGFTGLEDARVVRWNNKLYLTGVRRDVKDNGEGRMELSEIDITFDDAVELSRTRIPTTGDNTAYCEKNWMPIIGENIDDYTYVKWSNPTEIVHWDPINNKLEVVKSSTDYIDLGIDIRGGSHVVNVGDYYIAFGHSVRLWKPYAGEKDSNYDAHIIVWDKNFNLVKITPGFKFCNCMIEFCCGLGFDNNGYLVVSFSEMDNECYLLSINPDWFISNLINN
jgi:hypothetical protein